MSDFKENYKKIVNILEDAHGKINQIDDTSHKDLSTSIGHVITRVKTNLKREINQLNATGGVSDLVPNIGRAKKLRPLSKNLGIELVVRPSKKQAPKTQREFKEKAAETTIAQEGQQLNIKANELYDKFYNIKSDAIRDTYGDEEILAVAKLAELPITQQTKVDTKLIDSIKEAIKKQKELAEKEKKLTSKTDSATK